MRLVIIDPEVQSPGGHHCTTSTELCQAASECGTEAVLFDQSHFSSRTYLSEPEICDWLVTPECLSDDYANLDLVDGDRIMLHTASPWHLLALSEVVKRHENIRVAVGLLFQVEFWTGVPSLQARLTSVLQQSLRILENHGSFIYNEVGHFTLDGHTVSLPILHLPLSRKTLAELKQVRNAPRKSSRLRFGFFGQPRKEKGFALLLDFLSSQSADSQEFCFYLPEGFERACRAVEAIGKPDFVTAQMGRLDNQAFFQTMSECDVIMCFYDPDYYGSQMSGLVTESALLGKATLVTRNTEPERFLNRYAPGSSVAIDYSADSLRDVLAGDARQWRRAARGASASWRVLHGLKDARRFLRVSLGISSRKQK